MVARRQWDARQVTDDGSRAMKLDRRDSWSRACARFEPGHRDRRLVRDRDRRAERQCQADPSRVSAGSIQGQPDAHRQVRLRVRAHAMHALRTALGLALCLADSASAGTISLPADVSLSFTAEPHSNLHSGERIAFTLSVTNNGLEPATPVRFGSSPFVDEFDPYTGTSDCGNTLGLIVVDQNDGFYYRYSWAPTLEQLPLQVGETRYCYISLDYTASAPDTFALTFGLSSHIVDLDPSNNAATVILQRAPAGSPPAPVPSISLSALLLLGAGLAHLAAARLRRPHIAASTTSRGPSLSACRDRPDSWPWVGCIRR